MNPFRPGHRGFTLTEAIVALGIFAFAVVGLGIALDGVLEAGHMARQESLARQMIESRLAEIQARPALQEGEQSQAASERGVALREEIEPVNATGIDGQALTGLWKVRLTASWKDGGTDSEQVAEIVVYRN